MHRISLINRLPGTKTQRVFSGHLETNASGSWVADAVNPDLVLARWSVYGHSASQLPSAVDSGLLYPSAVDASCPDALDLNLTGVTSLTLRRCGVVGIINRVSGQPLTPTSIAITDTATTITFPGGTAGRYRLFLSEVSEIGCDPGDFVDGRLELPLTYAVLHSVVDGVATKPWSALTYADNKTYVSFAEGYSTVSTLLIAPAMLLPVTFEDGTVSLRLGCEYPMLQLGINGVATPVDSTVYNGFTYIDLTTEASPLQLVVSPWVYYTINPKATEGNQGSIVRFMTAETATADQIQSAVLLSHAHANLSSLARLTVNNGVLMVDGVAINTTELEETVDALVALLNNFTLPSHTHSMLQVDGLGAALSGKSATGHGHSLTEIANLKTVLLGKSNDGHSHEPDNITGLVVALATLATGLDTHTQPQSRVTNLVTDLGNKLNGTSVSALPASPVVNRLYVLTDDDVTFKAARGIYMWTGEAWLCVVQSYAYDLGELAGTVTLPAVSNVSYTGAVTDATTFVFPKRINPGNIVLQLNDGGSYVVSWPSNVQWAEDALPVLSVDATDWLVFASSNGYDWHGTLQIRGVVPVAREMISTWVTTTTNVEAVLPLVAAGHYNLTVDWGDGTVTTVRSYDDDGARHTYAAAGTYTVTLRGLATHWSFNNAGSKDLITAVTNLGDLGWTSLNGAFYGCNNLTSVAGGVTEQVTDFTNCFRACPLVVPNLSTWDMSAALTISGMFYNAVSANPDLAGITMPLVTVMTNAFRGMVSFTRTLSAAMFWENVNVTEYLNCFTDSINIANYGDIPNGWKGL